MKVDFSEDNKIIIPAGWEKLRYRQKIKPGDHFVKYGTKPRALLKIPPMPKIRDDKKFIIKLYKMAGIDFSEGSIDYYYRSLKDGTRTRRDMYELFFWDNINNNNNIERFNEKIIWIPSVNIGNQVSKYSIYIRKTNPILTKSK